jgi:hypothetical protein
LIILLAPQNAGTRRLLLSMLLCCILILLPCAPCHRRAFMTPRPSPPSAT